MKVIKLFLGLAVTVLAAGLIVNLSFAGKDEAGGHGKEEMAAYMEAGMPGAHHKQLKHLVGDWDAKLTMWGAPGAEPTVTHSKSKSELIMGGRYVLQHFEGEMMGMPYNGMGLIGYDKAEGKHSMVWLDNVSTAMMYSLGDCANHCKEETHVTSMKDPMGNDVKTKMVSTIVDENKHIFVMYMLDGDGGEHKQMEIVYTRS